MKTKFFIMVFLIGGFLVAQETQALTITGTKVNPKNRGFVAKIHKFPDVVAGDEYEDEEDLVRFPGSGRRAVLSSDGGKTFYQVIYHQYRKKNSNPRTGNPLDNVEMEPESFWLDWSPSGRYLALAVIAYFNGYANHPDTPNKCVNRSLAVYDTISRKTVWLPDGAYSKRQKVDYHCYDVHAQKWLPGDVLFYNATTTGWGTVTSHKVKINNETFSAPWGEAINVGGFSEFLGHQITRMLKNDDLPGLRKILSGLQTKGDDLLGALVANRPYWKSVKAYPTVVSGFITSSNLITTIATTRIFLKKGNDQTVALVLDGFPTATGTRWEILKEEFDGSEED